MSKKPNILLFGIDSLRSDHMSLYGYDRLTTPHIDKYIREGGVFFDNMFSASIPTTPGYSSMLTGLDCFSTDCVALRHEGGLLDSIKTLPEILGENGYTTTCIGFQGNAASRGFEKYIKYEDWVPDKAENMNNAAIPELKRLAEQDKPWLLFMRHMDPHSPYYTKGPFDRLFYAGDEFDKNNKSLKPAYEFKPFRDYFLTWFPEGCTDAEYIIAQYDSSIAYMDMCINQILETLRLTGAEDDTIVIFTSDHGETLDEHDCYFDHHSIYDNVLNVPLAIRYSKFPYVGNVADICQVKDLVPTMLSLCGIESDIDFDGRDLTKAFTEESIPQESEFYITEATWMLKHGWRTPEWKLIVALEPDFHFKPTVELYNLIDYPKENNNLAEKEPEVVKFLSARMEA
ncbi:MAG: sulfatase-like hydrolase/transferase, partial [Clostridiales bacterium]|nr:sulfatase-like hydrolase/transferase [Clostridiales bacterium]